MKYLFIAICSTLLMSSCSKDEANVEACSSATSKFIGGWSFTYTDLVTFKKDPPFAGQIENINDSTLNVKFRDPSKSPSSIQIKINPQTGEFNKSIPVGNHGFEKVIGKVSDKEFSLVYEKVNFVFRQSYKVEGTKQ